MINLVTLSLLIAKVQHSQVSDGGGVGEGCLGYEGDVVAVQWEDAKVLEAPEGLLLHTLQLVVGHDEGGEAGQVGKHQGRQHAQLVVAQVPDSKKLKKI